MHGEERNTRREMLDAEKEEPRQEACSSCRTQTASHEVEVTMRINVMTRVRRCGYCRHEVLGNGMTHDGVLYCSRSCRELGIEARSKRERGWGWLSFIALFCLFGVAVHPHPGWAHDPRTHMLDALSGATSEQYGVCCNGDDYERNPPYETTNDGYRVFAKGQWFVVSRRALVNNMQNPDGDAKVWVNGTDGAWYVRCFLPGSMF